MNSRPETRMGRRECLTRLGLGAIAAAGFCPRADVAAQPVEDPPNTHNMLVVGQQTVFLSHLPMFQGLDAAKTTFRSPHRYQVLLEAAFTEQGRDVSDRYFRDRQAHPNVRIYTLNPEPFVITRVFTPADKPRLPAFTASVFRGHLEQGGTLVPGLDGTQVQVQRVVHGGVFDPAAEKPRELQYLLFGKGTDLYLAHAIFAPPDFDQVLSIKTSGTEVTDQMLSRGIRVNVAGRKNVVSERLREGERVDATMKVGSRGTTAAEVQLEAGTQLYFEEGELLVPPTFDPTNEEKKG